jgi:hypothetical protein
MPPPIISRTPIRPDRLRRIDGQSFAFLPHRFLREGFLCSLTPTELRLYVFLVLAADRNGLSFYGFDRICATLEVDLDEFLDARNGLIDKDLLAFDGTRLQVLSLPARPIHKPSRQLTSRQDLEDQDPATVRQLIRDSLAEAAGMSRK